MHCENYLGFKLTWRQSKTVDWPLLKDFFCWCRPEDLKMFSFSLIFWVFLKYFDWICNTWLVLLVLHLSCQLTQYSGPLSEMTICLQLQPRLFTGTSALQPAKIHHIYSSFLLKRDYENLNSVILNSQYQNLTKTTGTFHYRMRSFHTIKRNFRLQRNWHN